MLYPLETGGAHSDFNPFAVPLYKHLNVVKKHFIEIVCSLTVGSAVAIISSFVYAIWMQLGDSLSNSLVPRSVTTPVAMDISKMIGGVPTMTAVFIIITSVVGGMMGTTIIRTLKIEEPTSKGLMLGMSALGAGIAKGFEIGELEGTFASLAMITAAIISIILAFTIFPALRSDLLKHLTYTKNPGKVPGFLTCKKRLILPTVLNY
ncbi:LrgB-like family protein [Bacillus sp. OV194]|nr:LrgB-like family protein [Bacillus sp. OV194]